MPSWQGRRYFSPAMVNHGIPKEDSPIAVMLNEHQLGRGHIKSLSSAFEEFKDGNKLAINNIISSSMNYVEFFRNHIEKENNVLFMLADKVLNETEQSKIFDAFEKLEVEKMGIGKHDEYHHLLKELKSIYSQVNLNFFRVSYSYNLKMIYLFYFSK